MDIYTTLLIILLAGVVLFQLMLSLGAPFGIAAWGGKYEGVLPRKLRVASVFSGFFLGFMITVVLSKADQIDLFPYTFESIFLWFMTIYFALGIVMNAISRSRIERLWAPYVAVLCALSLITALG